jgi:hypothetical protein
MTDAERAKGVRNCVRNACEMVCETKRALLLRRERCRIRISTVHFGHRAAP